MSERFCELFRIEAGSPPRGTEITERNNLIISASPAIVSKSLQHTDIRRRETDGGRVSIRSSDMHTPRVHAHAAASLFAGHGVDPTRSTTGRQQATW
jgi:hypothetical protein